MDNGLIFPYPCVCDHGESAILTALKHGVGHFVALVVWMRGT